MEAGGEPVTPTDPLTALSEHLAAENEPVEVEEPTDDLDLDEETDEAPEEPTAAIDPPVSLNAEEKALFAQLPPEAQSAWAASENRRNTQVQQATTKASEAQRQAEARAAQADAQAKQVYADQLSKFADALAPQAPDPALAAHDPMQYIAQKAQYDAAKAQHDEFVQQVQAIKSEAQTGVEQSFIQERDRQLLSIPEVQNEATRDAFFGKAFEAAAILGFDRDAVTSRASADEIKMLHTVASLKEKADKYDAAMSKQMQRVRQGKTKAMTPNAAQPRSAAGDAAIKQFEARPTRETAAELAMQYLQGR